MTTETNRWTPGPWVWVPSDGYVIAGDEQEWEVIANVPNPDNGPVLAAALELLAAVMAADVQRDPRHRVSMLVNDWERIEAAVAKAEGRGP